MSRVISPRTRTAFIPVLTASRPNCVFIFTARWSHRASSVIEDLGALHVYYISLDEDEEAEEFIIGAGAKSMPWYLFYAKNELKLSTPHADVLQSTIQSTLASSHLTIDNLPIPSLASLSSSIAFYVSGDQSSVGKTTTCMLLLASLLRHGVPAADIAYIKPVTQCEAEQGITRFSAATGITCVGIGPLVFYKGFTRAYLAKETEPSTVLLQNIKTAVDSLRSTHRIVLVDGVGYPSVGSICGVSNAHVAQVLELPVLLVGKKGVGDAVDSFNLNATYFESFGVSVLGAVFNNLPAEGYYSLEACQAAVTSYFTQYRPNSRVYGFIPSLSIPPNESNDSEWISFWKSSETVSIFVKHFDVQALLNDVLTYQLRTCNDELQAKNVEMELQEITMDPIRPRQEPAHVEPPVKRMRSSTAPQPFKSTPTPVAAVASFTPVKSREDIEREAKNQGATGG